jgi:hypothetical protein
MNKQTLPNLHKKQMLDIEQRILQIPGLKEKLENLKSALEITQDINSQKDLTSQITLLTAEIDEVKNAKMKYLLKNSDLLYNFNECEKKKKVVYNIDSLRSQKGPPGACEQSEKMTFYHKYRSNVDDEYVFTQESHINDENYCYDCKTYRVLQPEEACLVCEKCGSKTGQSSINEKQVVKDQTDNRFYEYKRYTHFSDWLDNLQGKENVVVPDEVIDIVIREIKRERKNEKIDELSEDDIRRYLKKYKKSGYDRFYDHSTQILFRVTDIKPLHMTTGQEQNLKLMFLQIQEPFELYKLYRTNFSSYGFIIFKFCQLLGYKDFLPKLKLHKNYAKLYEHDMIWKKICTFLGGAEKGWTFIKSYEY